MRPAPIQPHASSPRSGPTNAAPRDCRVARFATVAGCCHMFVFIAGANSSLARVANRHTVTRSSASPAAARASRSAVAGATTTTSGQSASSMCPTLPSSATSSTAERTGCLLTVASESSVTNAFAAGVVATRTSWPAAMKARTSSGAL